MSKKNKPNKKEDLDYKLFLEKQLNSKNYKNAVSEEEYLKTKAKLEKVKLRIKLLYNE
jgi:hypothetical protein